MTFTQIKYFTTLAECLSFTEAAKCLFISQPALSRQISVMEEELGTPLFIRDRKRLKLTPGGSILYNRLPHIMEEYNDAVSAALTANRGFNGHLSLGILDIYDISGKFAYVCSEFQKKYQDIELRLERFSLGELIERLNEGTSDIILTYGFSLYDKPDLVAVNIDTFDSCIMMNRNHPLAFKENLKLEDFVGDRFVQLGRDISAEGYRYIASICERWGLKLDSMIVNKMEDVLLWVQTGSAVAITSNVTMEKYNPDVVIRDIDIPAAKGHDLTMSWKKENYNPSIALFMELVGQTYENAKEREAIERRQA